MGFLLPYFERSSIFLSLVDFEFEERRWSTHTETNPLCWGGGGGRGVSTEGVKGCFKLKGGKREKR